MDFWLSIERFIVPAELALCIAGGLAVQTGWASKRLLLLWCCTSFYLFPQKSSSMSVMSSNSQHNRIFLPRQDMLGGGYSLLLQVQGLLEWFKILSKYQNWRRNYKNMVVCCYHLRPANSARPSHYSGLPLIHSFLPPYLPGISLLLFVYAYFLAKGKDM